MDKSTPQLNQVQKVFETKWFSIDAVFYQNSRNEPYYRLSCSDAVEIMAVTPDKKIILVRQFRPAVGISTLELPAGYIDARESREGAIIRELREETGYVCDSVTHMGSFKIAPSRINSTLHFFFGKGATVIEAKKETDEDAEVIFVTPDEFKKLVLEGKFVEVAGLAIYFLAQLQGFL